VTIPGTGQSTAAPAESRRRLGGWRAILLIACVILAFPPMIYPAEADFDSGWVIGLNMAFAQHMVFGRDILFSYGPLGFVLVPMDVGSNLYHAVIWRLFLHGLWWTSIWLVLSRLPGRIEMVLFAAVCILSGLTRGLDVSSYDRSSILLLTATSFLLLSYREQRLLWAVPAVIVSAFSLLGKFNVGVAALALLVAWFAAMLVQDHRRRTAAWLAGLAGLYVATVALLFRIYGGPLDALPPFLKGSWLIATGFSAQMSLWLPWWHTCHMDKLAVLGMGVLTLIVLWKLFRRRPAAAVFALLAIPVFFAYKAAIVRADWLHLYPALFLIPGMLAIALCWQIGGIERLAIRVLLVLGCFAGASCGTLLFGPQIYYSGLANLTAAFRTTAPLTHLAGSPSQGRTGASIPIAWQQMIDCRTVDVYPCDIGLVYENKLNWWPRLVLQSYAAYHPYLDKRGAEHYSGPGAPEFILYRHVAIDFQNPCAVDPQTWLEILRRYDVAEASGELLLLKRRQEPRWAEASVLRQESVRLGERIEVSSRFSGRVVLEARLRLSAAGSLKSALYKTAPNIVVEYEDGQSERFRTVWRNLEGGFLVNDLPWQPAQAREYFTAGRSCPVRAITFQHPDGCFAPEISLTWRALR
jgi:hypothetical protein